MGRPFTYVKRVESNLYGFSRFEAARNEPQALGWEVIQGPYVLRFTRK